MYTIKATIADVRASAAEIEREAAVIKKDVAAIEQVVEALRKTFLGERAAQFFSQFGQARQQMDQWDDIVRSFAAELTEAANRYQAADKA
jgi:WXG100 family type VII secretion target